MNRSLLYGNKRLVTSWNHTAHHHTVKRLFALSATPDTVASCL